MGGYLLVYGSNVSRKINATTTASDKTEILSKVVGSLQNAVTSIPKDASAGFSVEFLFRVSTNGAFNKAGNTTILASGDPSGDNSTGWGIVMDRHWLSCRIAGRVLQSSLTGAKSKMWVTYVAKSTHGQ